MRAYERLIDYTRFPTASSETSGKTPSTDAQFGFARYLVDEMKRIGISDAYVDENCYVMGTVPATDKSVKTVLGFIAHMDVSPDAPCENVKCVLHENYDGGVIDISGDGAIKLDPKDYPVLNNYVGETLLTTDGTTLLGADDKAGIAEILTAAERLIGDPSIKHGKLRIAFTPDEEIGEGADHFDVERFGADYAFTVDGASAGEVEYETFNAAGAAVTLTGFSIHPGEAKDKLINAIDLAYEFDRLLPAEERPQYTSGYEGFYHMVGIEGGVEKTECQYIIRDHDRAKLEKRKKVFRLAAETINRKYGEERATVAIKDSYYNMAEIVLSYPKLLEAARQATRSCGIEPVSNPVRGGTDGSRLSFMGLPCPNLGTGSHNHHGRGEFAVIEEMDKIVDILVDLAGRFD